MKFYCVDNPFGEKNMIEMKYSGQPLNLVNECTTIDNIRFVNDENLRTWISMGTTVVCPVIIPNDAVVTRCSQGQFQSDKIILEKPINVTDYLSKLNKEDYLKILKNNPSLISSIPEEKLTNKMCLELIEYNPLTLKYLPQEKIIDEL